MLPDDGPYPNPNGVWTAGYAASVPATTGATLIPYNVSGPWPDEQNLHCFYVETGDGEGDSEELPYFCQNIGNNPYATIAPRQIALHPYAGSYKYSILRWYAPKPGTYEVNATFYQGQPGAIEAQVYVFTGYPSGNVVVPMYNVTTTTTVIRTVDLSAGAYIDVIVGSDEDGYSLDATPVDVTIRDVRCIGDTG